MASKRPVFVRLALSFSLLAASPHALAHEGGTVTEKLVRVLEYGDAQARRNAAACLGTSRPSALGAIPALINALGDGDLGVRWNASHALSQIGPAVGEDLLRTLKDGNIRMRRGAAETLGLIGPNAQDALPALVAALKDTDAVVREEASGAIARWGARAQPAVAPLIALLADGDPYVSGKAAYALRIIGKGSVPALIGALMDTNRTVRWCSAIALSKMGPEAREAIPALVNALGDSDDNTRSTAAVALENMGTVATTALPGLRRCLYDRDEDVRRNADLALGKIDPARRSQFPNGHRVEALIDSVTPVLMHELHVPGVSVALVRNRSLVWSRTYGLADVNRRMPVKRETLFEAASMTKPVFAYTVLKLAEQGRIDLDRPLVEYLHERVLPDGALRRQITARMVLSHTSGFPNWRKGEEERDGPLPVLFRPGTRFSYSGEGIYYLQKAVERITGEPLAVFAERTLFEPLGLARTSYVWSESLDTNLASGHDANGMFLQKTRYTHANAAYTLYTTAEEYAEFLVEIMKTDRSALHSLSGRSVHAMLAHAVALDARAPIGRPGRARGLAVYWGLGWSVNTTESGDIVHHSGANRSGFRCFCQFSPRRGTGIVIMTNGIAGDELWTRLISAVGDM